MHPLQAHKESKPQRLLAPHLQCASAIVLIAACVVHEEVVAQLMQPRGWVLHTAGQEAAEQAETRQDVFDRWSRHAGVGCRGHYWLGHS
jgi:hypothetical protein